jgi:hypothetical protein
MNTIIYSYDFEAITAIELPLAVIESAEKNGGIMLALKKEDNPNPFIKVECHKIIWADGTLKSVFITKDEELALLLKPDWLVGQKGVIGAYQRTLKILTDKLKKLRSDD